MLNKGQQNNYHMLQNDAFGLAKEWRCQLLESNLDDLEKSREFFMKIIHEVTTKIPVPPDPIEISKTKIDIGD